MRRYILLLSACLVPYLPFFPLPFLSDDYLQLTFSREYISTDGIGDLLRDALYRCRATSLLLTRGVDALFGANPAIHRAASLLVHFCCCLAVAALGRYPRITYQVSVPAAFVFALREGHQEAVVWTAALHDLLVTLASLLFLGAFLRSLQTGRYLTPLLLFLLALYSKESAAILPLMALALWWLEARSQPRHLRFVALLFAITLLYAAATFSASRDHLHLNDGTFSPRAPFVLTNLHSLWRMLLPWGLAALAFTAWRQPRFAVGALAFASLALLPCSFLTYMNRVPSRHTYFAGVFVSLLIARAFADLPNRRLAVALALLFALHNPLYLWTRKLGQYQLRAQPTEEFVRRAGQGSPPLILDCAPYRTEVFEAAGRVRLGWPRGAVLPKGAPSDARHLCLEPLP
jgi:hypothetical protein